MTAVLIALLLALGWVVFGFWLDDLDEIRSSDAATRG